MDGAFHSLQHIRRSRKFRSLSAVLEMETLSASYQENDYPLGCQVSSPMQRRENRGHDNRYHDLDIRT